MRRRDPIRLALLGLALTVPAASRAGDDAPVSRIEAASPAATPHKHGWGKTAKMCASCQAKAKAQAGVVPPPVMQDGSRIVGCAHSSNGVCRDCRKILEMPGTVTMMAPGTPTAAPAGATVVASTEAPGRAVASDAAPGRAVADNSEPVPMGLMRTDYAPVGTPSTPMPIAASGPAGPKAPAGGPGAGARPMAGGPGSSPYMPQSHAPKVSVLSHLFGLAPLRQDLERDFGGAADRRRQAHAAEAYDPAAAAVGELPASMVYGKKSR